MRGEHTRASGSGPRHGGRQVTRRRGDRHRRNSRRRNGVERTLSAVRGPAVGILCRHSPRVCRERGERARVEGRGCGGRSHGLLCRLERPSAVNPSDRRASRQAHATAGLGKGRLVIPTECQRQRLVDRRARIRGREDRGGGSSGRKHLVGVAGRTRPHRWDGSPASTGREGSVGVRSRRHARTARATSVATCRECNSPFGLGGRHPQEQIGSPGR